MAEEEYTVRTTTAWMKQEHPLKFEDAIQQMHNTV